MTTTKKNASSLPELETDDFDVLERKYRYFEAVNIKTVQSAIIFAHLLFLLGLSAWLFFDFHTPVLDYTLTFYVALAVVGIVFVLIGIRVELADLLVPYTLVLIFGACLSLLIMLFKLLRMQGIFADLHYVPLVLLAAAQFWFLVITMECAAYLIEKRELSNEIVSLMDDQPSCSYGSGDTTAKGYRFV